MHPYPGLLAAALDRHARVVSPIASPNSEPSPNPDLDANPSPDCNPNPDPDPNPNPSPDPGLASVERRASKW